MNDIQAVTVCDSGRELSRHKPRFGLGKIPTMVDIIEQIAVLRQLEHKVDSLVRLDNAVDEEY